MADCEVLAETIVKTTKDCFISKSAFTAMLQDLVRQERKKQNQIEELMNPGHKPDVEISGGSQDNILSNVKPTFYKTSLENYKRLVSPGSNVVRIHDNALKQSSEEKHLSDFFRAMISRTASFIGDLFFCRFYV